MVDLLVIQFAQLYAYVQVPQPLVCNQTTARKAQSRAIA